MVKAGKRRQGGRQGAARSRSEMGRVQRQLQQIAAQLQAQGTELVQLRRHLAAAMRREAQAAGRQVEASVAIAHLLAHGTVMPGMHGWPVSPDFALYLTQRVAGQPYDAIVEFGSGTSTLLMARVLAGRTGAALPCRQVAFEHLPAFHAQTAALLQQAALADAVQLVLAPLLPWPDGDGQEYPYYDCAGALQHLSTQLPPSGARVLVVVDGPPGATGPQARYPALAHVRAALPDCQLDVLLDDYIRPDERAVADRWVTELQAQGCTVQRHELKMEKDACLIEVLPPSSACQTPSPTAVAPATTLTTASPAATPAT